MMLGDGLDFEIEKVFIHIIEALIGPSGQESPSQSIRECKEISGEREMRRQRVGIAATTKIGASS
jgi:hypothetical protein